MPYGLGSVNHAQCAALFAGLDLRRVEAIKAKARRPWNDGFSLRSRKSDPDQFEPALEDLENGNGDHPCRPLFAIRMVRILADAEDMFVSRQAADVLRRACPDDVEQ